MYSGSKKEKNKYPYLFQYKLSYRNETGTNHHGFLSTSISCFKTCLKGPYTWWFLPKFNFSMKNPKFDNEIIKLIAQIA